MASTHNHKFVEFAIFYSTPALIHHDLTMLEVGVGNNSPFPGNLSSRVCHSADDTRKFVARSAACLDRSNGLLLKVSSATSVYASRTTSTNFDVASQEYKAKQSHAVMSSVDVLTSVGHTRQPNSRVVSPIYIRRSYNRVSDAQSPKYQLSVPSHHYTKCPSEEKTEFSSKCSFGRRGTDISNLPAKASPNANDLKIKTVDSHHLISGFTDDSRGRVSAVEVPHAPSSPVEGCLGGGSLKESDKVLDLISSSQLSTTRAAKRSCSPSCGSLHPPKKKWIHCYLSVGTMIRFFLMSALNFCY